MKLLVAADGSGKLRDSALPAIGNLAGNVIPEVIALHVVRAASEAWSDEELKQVMAKRQHRMEALVTDADFAVQLLVEALPYGGEVAHYIALRASDLEVDAVVVTSHRATGVMAGLLGSVAQGVLRDSEVPVIVVRPADVPDDEDDAGFD
jgi:nucleotide-binding universal stress UspA family protein